MTESDIHYQVIVVGAGPAGLAMAYLLDQHKINYLVVDQSNQIGGLYATLHPELELLSPARFNSLPGVKFSSDNARVSVASYHDYLKFYAQKFPLNSRFDTHINNIKYENSRHILQTTCGEVLRCKSLVIATGMTCFPKPLPWNGSFEKVDLHTGVQWKGIDYYKNKRVWVVGSGTSACELAALLVGHAELTLLVNKPVKPVPLYFAGINIHYWVRPLELISKKLYPGICKHDYLEPVIDTGIKDAMRRKLLTIVDIADTEFVSGKLFKGEGDEVLCVDPEVIINCTGFHFDTSIVGETLDYEANRMIKLHKNCSDKDKRLYFLGFPCSGGIDSKFLRGIKRDAYRIIKQIV